MITFVSGLINFSLRLAYSSVILGQINTSMLNNQVFGKKCLNLYKHPN